MGHGTYEITHSNIIESGKYSFMNYGYERTNLRELCKEAGITTGSFYRHFSSKEELFGTLVEPAVEGIYKMYHNSEEICFDYMDTDYGKENQNIKEMWKISNETVEEIINFVYDNFDCFKLLLECADGTKYSSFIEDIVNMEVNNSIKTLDIMHKKGFKVHRISENELHMLIHAYLSCIFESVIHNYTREEALGYVHTVVRFFNAGWQEILGF